MPEVAERQEVCDFCSSPAVKYVYPCRDFRQDIPASSTSALSSIGSWAACAACMRLIERGDRENLSLRSARRQVRTNPNAITLARRVGFRTFVSEIRQLHDTFWANRQGPPIEHPEAE